MTDYPTSFFILFFWSSSRSFDWPVLGSVIVRAVGPITGPLAGDALHPQYAAGQVRMNEIPRLGFGQRS